jgi:hypothetical protein
MVVSLRLVGRGTLGLERLDAGDVAAHFLMRAGRSSWFVAAWKRRLKASRFKVAQILVQLVVALGAQISDLGHYSPPRCEVSPSLATTLVLIGSFIAARSNAPQPVAQHRRVRTGLPGFTRAAQYSIEPLPLP